MQKEVYRQLYQIEEKHWYADNCRNLIASYLKCIRKRDGLDFKILDVGSGTGGMYDLLKGFGDVTCLEISDYAVDLMHKRYPDVEVKIGSANKLSELFPQGAFNLITFFNVLCHKWITDDVSVLKQVASILPSEGYLILYVSAFNCLYHDNDKICYSTRRYTHKKMSNILSLAGFRLEKSTYFNSISFPIILLLAMLQRIGIAKIENSSYELRMPAPIINFILKNIMVLERVWIKTFGSLPIGVSLLCVAKKEKINNL